MKTFIRSSNFFLENRARCAGGSGDLTPTTGDTMTCKVSNNRLIPKVIILSPLSQEEVKKLWFDYQMEYTALPSSAFVKEDDTWVEASAIAAETLGDVDLEDSCDFED